MWCLLMMSLSEKQIREIIIAAAGSYQRFEHATIRARGRYTGYRSPYMCNTRERVVAALWLRGMKQSEIAWVLGYRSAGTVPKILRRSGIIE